MAHLANPTPSPLDIPQADNSGKIASGWLPNASGSILGGVYLPTDVSLGGTAPSTSAAVNQSDAQTYIGSQITSALSSYVTSTALGTTLASYETTANLATTLGNYVTSSSLTTTLAAYETSAALTTTLGSYATTSALSALVSNDSTLGGSSASTTVAPSEAAVQAYVAAHGSGGGASGTQTPTANAIPESDSSGLIATGWLPQADATHYGTVQMDNGTLSTATTTVPTSGAVHTAIGAISMPAASSTTPLVDGTAAIGSSAAYARADHVHPAASGGGGGLPTSLSPTGTSVTLTTGQMTQNLIVDDSAASGLLTVTLPTAVLGMGCTFTCCNPSAGVRVVSAGKQVFAINGNNGDAHSFTAANGGFIQTGAVQPYYMPGGYVVTPNIPGCTFTIVVEHNMQTSLSGDSACPEDALLWRVTVGRGPVTLSWGSNGTSMFASDLIDSLSMTIANVNTFNGTGGVGVGSNVVPYTNTSSGTLDPSFLPTATSSTNGVVKLGDTSTSIVSASASSGEAASVYAVQQYVTSQGYVTASLAWAPPQYQTITSATTQTCIVSGTPTTNQVSLANNGVFGNIGATNDIVFQLPKSSGLGSSQPYNTAEFFVNGGSTYYIKVIAGQYGYFIGPTSNATSTITTGAVGGYIRAKTLGTRFRVQFMSGSGSTFYWAVQVLSGTITFDA